MICTYVQYTCLLDYSTVFRRCKYCTYEFDEGEDLFVNLQKARDEELSIF